MFDHNGIRSSLVIGIMVIGMLAMKPELVGAVRDAVMGKQWIGFSWSCAHN